METVVTSAIGEAAARVTPSGSIKPPGDFPAQVVDLPLEDAVDPLAAGARRK